VFSVGTRALGSGHLLKIALCSDAGYSKDPSRARALWPENRTLEPCMTPSVNIALVLFVPKLASFIYLFSRHLYEEDSGTKMNYAVNSILYCGNLTNSIFKTEATIWRFSIFRSKIAIL